MRKVKINTAFFLLILLFVTSCGNDNIYFKYHSVNPDGWYKDSVFVFNIDIENPYRYYDVYINVRHAPNFPNQNLWLFISEISPDGVLSKDTIEFFLADHRGRWLGSGAGSIKEMQVRYREDFKFPEAGTYTFKIQHGMRAEHLRGVTEIGMQVN